MNTVGRYELVRRLAGGGMGEVFAARFLGAEGFVKDVALKRIYPHLAGSPKHRQLFVREAKLVAQLSHPNIVQVLELGTEGDDLFMAMEFVAGVTLAEVQKRFRDEKRRLPFQIVVAIANDLLEALAYAHEFNDPERNIRGIIHADVSPQNVMLTRQGRAKLCDFGVAKLLRSTNHEATQRERWGKLSYMAPELIRDNQLDARSDIYAVAIMMQETLTGERAFAANNAADLSRAVLRGDRKSIYTSAAETPVEVAAVIERGAAVDPKQRFASASAMRRALLEAAGTESLDDSRQWLTDLVADFEQPRGGSVTSVTNVAATGTPGDTVIARGPRRLQALTLALAVGILVLTGAAATFFAARSAPRPVPVVATRAAPEPLPEPALEPELEPELPGTDEALATAPPNAAPRRPVPELRPSRVTSARAAKPKSTRAPALLTLNSVPWAYVTLDGQRLPKPTPLFDYALEPGVHTIQLRAANGRTETLSLELQAGQVVRRVVNLE